jgi:GT2 family glycosyltransferase
MNDNTSVCAVIVTYNRLELLKKTIESLRSQSRRADKILVINNGSTDGTDVWLCEQSDLTCLTQENLGGAGGFHTGMKVAYEEGFSWLWCMDDDVAPESECLAELLCAAKSRARAGIVVPVRVTRGGLLAGPEKIKFNFSVPSKPYGFPRIEEVYKTVEGLGKEPIQIEGMTFEGPMISREIVHKVGLPNPELFILMDDADYSFRASRVAEIYMVPTAKLTRNLDEPKVTKASWKDYYYVRNQTWLDVQYGNWLVKLFRPLWHGLAFLKGRILTNRVEHPGEQVALVFKGLLHGYLGITGKRH